MKDSVFTLRRLLIAVAVLVVAAVAWSAWLGWRTERDLRAADAAVDRLQAAVTDGDDAARDAAVDDLRDAAASAADRTDGFWWAGLTNLPVYGDDAAGVEALSASVDLVARDAVTPLVDTVDSLDGIVADGRIDVDQVAALQQPVNDAATAMRQAVDLVEPLDSRDFAPALRTRYDDYTKRLAEVAGDFKAAGTAVDVLPAMLGADGPRDYLFIFQNNAEIRSTGGLPGSWARIHVEDGKVELLEQGSAGDLNTDEQVVELTAEEDAVYDELPALFFQDPNFIPDFPRAAELFEAFWDRKYPDTDLDGVLALDPVGMSYLMDGTGPVQVGDLTLTADNIVDELLSNTYLTIKDPAEQDERFQAVARAIFEAATGDLASPIDFVQGFAKAASERRFLVSPFDQDDAAVLRGATILGALAGDDGATPHVDIGLNDATGSKMSYYLRYFTEVRSRGCEAGTQSLTGSMTFSQTIGPRAAKELPTYVTGGGQYGIPVGTQLVALRIYGPFGGSISNVRVDGKNIDTDYGLEIDGRPVVTTAPIIETLDNVIVTWDMKTGPGQVGDGRTTVTPGIAPGPGSSRFRSACS
ncbi:DUF4012 domain-containing protein [Nocardioides rubriscoriae]|uniref:DUF4012 domain-containing protein n=1 Tax=Nocardioides rubriscoriae TaxID=642762 RepID=UPI0011E066E4|nr:DUF4012 domain-containing protein [Nocardioides rubriscoriae]